MAATASAEGMVSTACQVQQIDVAVEGARICTEDGDHQALRLGFRAGAGAARDAAQGVVSGDRDAVRRRWVSTAARR